MFVLDISRLIKTLATIDLNENETLVISMQQQIHKTSKALKKR